MANNIAARLTAHGGAMKKTADTPIQQTLSFAKQHYGSRQALFGETLVEHCVAVAYMSETIAQKLYQDVRADFMPDDTKDSISAIVQTALLHDILNVSACAFENIAEVTTVQIAAMVADISRDFRLVETKRDMEFRGRLSQSPVGAQIVVVADIICTAKAALSVLQAAGIAAVPKTKKVLTQLDGDLLAIHAANRFYMLRLYVHAARNLLSDVSQAIKNCRQKAKLDKCVAQNTKALRERVAAEEKAAAAESKKRKVRYAKKRSSSQDS
jgi:(p)ppGpp synthase/HD superfamily hydrolase